MRFLAPDFKSISDGMRLSGEKPCHMPERSRGTKPQNILWMRGNVVRLEVVLCMEPSSKSLPKYSKFQKDRIRYIKVSGAVFTSGKRENKVRQKWVCFNSGCVLTQKVVLSFQLVTCLCVCI